MESLARISSLLESARELTLDAAQATRSSRNSRPLDRTQIKKLLDSRNERDVLDGLRRVLANVASPNIEIKKLVYIYLIHHAEQEPDLALLSINTIQNLSRTKTPKYEP
ncbi:unnamed protein product [Parascedosporium putredinis]|uniref:Clathrin/coatomer adaptor adaptin-like N-terminal domain-containing protein n=1 Tax=Parascedosporium putredinis TaxID=1442378 RepID=A0A9P1GUP3_9PEZI|nr:unnamed protein product [Parascedosporium putredinis]CAI7987982.1 unnamed protein product [Parascedosporium putredinis]